MTNHLHNIEVMKLKGVGSSLVGQLARLNICYLQDLLFHFPVRYQDRTFVTPINQLKMGVESIVRVEVVSSSVIRRGKQCFIAEAQDGTGSIQVRFYFVSSALHQQFSPGNIIECFGEARRGARSLEFYHPEYCNVNNGGSSLLSKSLTPVYPTTEGLKQKKIRNLCQQALGYLNDSNNLTELLPASVYKHLDHRSLSEAIKYLHNPPADANLSTLAIGNHPVQQRLIIEELLAHHLSLRKARQRIQEQPGFSMNINHTLTNKLSKSLSFKLTNAQKTVSEEIRKDLEKSVPMLRLVQGDVGSGKTIVSALAATQALGNKYQVALMAPTEILVDQHYRTFTHWLEPLGVAIIQLTGKMRGKKREESLALINSNSAQMIIGTHALFQDDVSFNRLGLVIIDEQHRFGVHQRLAIKEKGLGGVPHQLIMTATPIPRTFSMSVYADLDSSIINEMPPGRMPVKTMVVGDDRRSIIIERVNSACLEGRQAYWVCTLIDESEALECQAAHVTFESLTEMLPDLKIGLIHGRMKSREKNDVMLAFKEGKIHLLVATTVIEVGVDVPNASLMIIDNPERLGLAQLHQLRGRVGRGSMESHCVLMYKKPLSKQGKERLQVLRDFNDGFLIAEKDLIIRGPGDMLGIRQTGAINFKIADLQRDSALLESISGLANILIKQVPENIDALIERWLPEKNRYLEV